MTQYPGEILIVVKFGLQSKELIHRVPLAHLGLSRVISATLRLAAAQLDYHRA